MPNPLESIEQMGAGLLERAVAPTIMAPLQLPLIEQFFNDVYDQRFAFGTFSQVRWLQGVGQKRRWRKQVDQAYEQMGIVILNEMISLTAFQLGRLQREMVQAETLRFDVQRLRILNEHALEIEFARADHANGLQRANALLQAKIDQAGERLRHANAMEAQRGTQQHELAMENQRLLGEITRRVDAVRRTTEGLAAVRQIWDEIDAINLLTNEDEKHRRLQMLQQALPWLLRFDG